MLKCSSDIWLNWQPTESGCEKEVLEVDLLPAEPFAIPPATGSLLELLSCLLLPVFQKVSTKSVVFSFNLISFTNYLTTFIFYRVTLRAETGQS